MPERKNLNTAKSLALKYLTYRARSRKEMGQYLKKKELAPLVVEQTLKNLEEAGYLDDQRFAMDWGRWRVEKKKFGKIRLRQELITKGIADDIIQTIFTTLYDLKSEKFLAMECAKKKLSSLDGLQNEKKMRLLANHLQRRGYSSDIVYETLKVTLKGSQNETP